MTKLANEDVVLLLGAGASIEWVEDGEISTAKLTCFVLELLESEMWLKSLETISGMNNHTVNKCNQNVLNILFKARNKYEDFNFETIVALFDTIGTITQTSDESYYLPNLVRHIYEADGKSDLENDNYKDILFAYPLLLRYFLIQHFFELCEDNNFASPIKATLIRRTREFIAELEGPVSIVSLNYDTFFQDIIECMGYTNGFFPGVSPPFRIQKLLNAPKRILYPHGSICLLNSINRDSNVFCTKWSRNREVVLRMLRKKTKQILSWASDPNEKVDGLLFSQSIISGISKGEVTSVHPFSDYYFASVQALS